MKEVLNFILNNWDTGLGISLFIYELIARQIPTEKNRSILDFGFKIISEIVKNKRKPSANDQVVGTQSSNKNRVVVDRTKFILSLVFLLTSLGSIAQTYGNFKSIRLVNVLDSTTISPVNATIYYNEQSNKLRAYQNDAWYDLIPASTAFSSNVTFVLSSGKSFGKYTNGQTAPWAGLTAVQAMQDAAIEYISPAFSAFSITGQSTTVEVGTTLSGSKTFTWTIAANSGVVPTIDIYNITTSSTLVSGTLNDGTQAATITTVQLNSNGATQSWRGIGNNTSPVGTFNSSAFTVTGRFYDFYGPTATSPTNSATVRALPSSAFYTGSTTFTLNTGSTLIKFVVALPPGITITSVIDLDALSANITSEYVLTGTINVLDAGGTNRPYNIYEMDIAIPYSSSHRHSITIN